MASLSFLTIEDAQGAGAHRAAALSTEISDVLGLSDDIVPRKDVTLRIARKDGSVIEQPVKLRIDTPIEVDYYRHGGILPFVLRQLLG